MDELENIYGIGPVKAQELLSLGLVDIHSSISVRKQLLTPSVFPKLSKLTQADLKYKPNKKIKREDIQMIEKYLGRVIAEKHDVAGSYRRGKPISRDMDLVILHAPFTEDSAVTLVNRINGTNGINRINGINSPKIIHVFARGSDKIGAIMQYGNKRLKIDIFAAQKDNYVPMLLFATGSAKFNIAMRAIAKRRGMLLNQHGLYRVLDDGYKKINIKTEKQFFKYLNIYYLEPKSR
jgi:DNA polymerase/3'-5' exonuclease PolX